MTLMANSNTKYVIRVDFYDNWVEMEISIMAHKLPIEKYVFDNKWCHFGNFTNVSTTGCIKLKMRVTYDCMEGVETYYT